MAPPLLPFEAFLQVRTATAGTFSPDARALAFLLNTTGVPQLYRLDGPGQTPRPLTSFSEAVRSVDWSPDGRWLLFTMDSGGSECEQLYVVRPDGSELRALTEQPQAIHHFGCWSPDSSRIAFAANRRDPACFDLYLLEVATGHEERIYESDGYYDVLDWASAGDQLLVRRQNSNFDHDLLLLDLASREMRRVTAHEGPARYVSARFLPDNRSVLLCTDQDRDYLCLARLDTRLQRLRPLLERRADVESCDLAGDGRQLAAVLNREGWSELVFARLDERCLRGLVSVRLPGVALGCRMARNGARVALSVHGPTENPNVWEVDPGTTSRVQWTRAPRESLDGIPLVEPAAVQFPTHDGRSIPAFLYRPAAAAGERLPVVVHIHGGPEGQDRPGFSAIYQYLVHRGYAVLAPNIRGSTGYGNTYCHLDDREKRYDAIRDVEYAHRWLVESGLADPARIAIMGASYGGFMVLACLTRQPERWAAGVDIVGVANFETFFRHTGPWRRTLRAAEYGDPVADAALLRDLSPIHRVDAIRAPLLVIQGANDPRVPQEESDQMVEQLRARRHPVEYLLFEDEGHGIVKLPNRVRAYTAVASFLDEHLR